MQHTKAKVMIVPVNRLTKTHTPVNCTYLHATGRGRVFCRIWLKRKSTSKKWRDRIALQLKKNIYVHIPNIASELFTFFFWGGGLLS